MLDTQTKDEVEFISNWTKFTIWKKKFWDKNPGFKKDNPDPKIRDRIYSTELKKEGKVK